MSGSNQFVDLTGRQFGRLLVVGFGGRRKRARVWLCRCSCGTTRVVYGSHLVQGNTRSCGCYSADFHRKHGRSHKGDSTYDTWDAMKQRCSNPNNRAYHNYGGRGITVCQRWLTFENFLADMGERPEHRSLDRIDNDRNYEPGNCRWATKRQQENNTRRNVILEYQGTKKTVTEWARALGICPSTLRLRLWRGWDTERALSHPARQRRTHA